MSAPILRALRAAMLATLTLTTIALPIAVAAQCVDYADYQHGIDAWFAHNTALDAAEGGGFAYFAEAGAGVMVISIGDPLHPRSVATIDTPGLARAVACTPPYLYIADEARGLHICPVFSGNFAIAGSVDTPGNARGVAVVGNYAFVADYTSGLQVVDVSDPAHPVIIGSVNTPGYAQSVAIAGDYAYVADYYSLQVIDVSDPTAPQMVHSVSTASFALSVVTAGTHAYVADSTRGLTVVDIADPTQAAVIVTVATPGVAKDVHVAGNRAYLACDGQGVQVVDISDPHAPALSGSIDATGSAQGVAAAGNLVLAALGDEGIRITNALNLELVPLRGSLDTPGAATGLAQSGNVVLVADGAAGLQVIDVTDVAAPQLLRTVTLAGRAVNVAVAGNLACVAVPEYGLQLVAIDDPANAVVVGGLPIPGAVVDVAVAGIHAIIAVSGSDALHVVDISAPMAPLLVGSVSWSGDVRAVAVDGTFAYVADVQNGLVAVDISDPSEPVVTFVDGQAGARDVAVANALLWTCDGALRSFDLADPAHPAHIRDWSSWMDQCLSMTISGTTAYITGDDSGILVLDVADPENPRRMGGRTVPGSAQACVVTGDDLFVASNFSGLQILAAHCDYVSGVNTESPAGATSLLRLAPNPTSGRTSFLVSADKSMGVEVGIYDLAGRIIRRFPAADGADAITRHLEWDGRDDRGKAAAAGVYLVRLETAGRVIASRKLTMLR